MAMRPRTRRGALVTGAAGIAAALTVLFVGGPALGEPHASSRAHHGATCADRLLKDWRDGRIQGVYPLPCYQQTIRSLPTDVRLYSSAEDDIRQAFRERIAQS